MTKFKTDDERFLPGRKIRTTEDHILCELRASCWKGVLAVDLAEDHWEHLGTIERVRPAGSFRGGFRARDLNGHANLYPTLDEALNDLVGQLFGSL